MDFPKNRFSVVEAEGSHYEIGLQVGTQCKELGKRMVEYFKNVEIGNAKWQAAVLQANRHLPFVDEFCPELMEEFRGYVDGAEVDFDELFTVYCHRSADLLNESGQKCTDIVVSGDATADGCVYDVHNEDWTGEELACLVRCRPTDEPAFLMMTYGGVFPTNGINSAGVSITGNLVSPNDARIGVPKAFSVRKVLKAESIREAIDYALPQNRASCYNHTLADANGEIYCLEGSATDFEVLYGTDGYLVHTNHYVSDRMRRYEKDPSKMTDSVVRYNRALRLLSKQVGRITLDLLKTVMSDHIGFPNSICRHRPEGSTTTQIATIFSVITDVTHKTMLLCRTNPCRGEYEKYEIE